METQPMSPDTFVALVILAVIFGAAIMYGLSKVYFWFASRGFYSFGSVNSYAYDDPRDYVTHEDDERADTSTDPGLSDGLSAPSARVPAQVEALMVDRSRASVVAALVAAGWKVGEIRVLLKGDTGAIGEEIKAERKRQGLDVEEGRVIPVNGGREGYIRI